MAFVRDIIDRIRSTEGPARVATVVGAVAAVLAIPVTVVVTVAAPGRDNTASIGNSTTRPALIDAPTNSTHMTQTPTESPDPTDSATPSTTSSSAEVDVDTTALPTQPTWLTDLSTVDRSKGGYYYEGAYAANGVRYTHAAAMWASCSSTGEFWVDFNLGRSHSHLKVTVGLDDKNSAGVTVSYAVYVDNVEREAGALQAGMDLPLNIALDNALRLRLLINDPAPAMCGGKSRKAHVVWGDARLI